MAVERGADVTTPHATPHAVRTLRRVLGGLQLLDATGRPRLSDGGLELLKWVALVLMTLDHVNKYLLHDQVDWMFAAGRTVMPVFSFVLAFNLARPGAQPGGPASGAAARAAIRLGVFGLIATPMSWALIGPWPLNILFMLASAAWIIHLLQGGRRWAATLVGLISGFLVEFWWPAIGATVAAWAFCRAGSRRAAAAWVACLWSLTLINGNLWALAAIPMILIGMQFGGARLRAKWWFYAYYPAHLGALLLLGGYSS